MVSLKLIFWDNNEFDTEGLIEIVQELLLKRLMLGKGQSQTGFGQLIHLMPMTLTMTVHLMAEP